MLLGDVYSMFYLPLKRRRVNGGCNFPIALTLLCVINGLSTFFYPTAATVRIQEKRFKKPIRDRLHWGPRSKGWIAKDDAAALLYFAFRNSLVHEPAQDKPLRTRKKGFGEPIAGKWGAVALTLAAAPLLFGAEVRALYVERAKAAFAR